MVRLKRILATVVAVLLAGVAAGCGTVSDETVDEVRDGVGDVQDFLGDASFSLPAIVVEVDRDGRVDRIGGFDADFVDDVFEARYGYPLTGRLVKFDLDLLQRLDAADIQLVTVASRPEGVFVLVNGRPLPHVAWDNETINGLETVLGLLVESPAGGDAGGMWSLLTPDSYESAGKVLQLLKTVNVRVDVRLPTMDGRRRTEIAIPDDEAFTAALTDAELDKAPLQTVDLIVDYRPVDDERPDSDWVPSLFGFTTLDFQAMSDATGSDREVPELRMRDDVRRRIEGERIDSVGAEARADGLFVTVNDVMLPNLAWSETTLVNLSHVLLALYPDGIVEDEGSTEVDWLEAVQSSAPMYNDYAVAVLLRFPLAEE